MKKGQKSGRSAWALEKTAFCGLFSILPGFNLGLTFYLNLAPKPLQQRNSPGVECQVLPERNK
ncbi:MAG: hypothetical protein CO090_10165 [Acidobacteria bacterium CG_4_9_14_3_um_filter_49_7]|nr:MAG: hypothetical protein CO090_10165 [Acidobacteria bacterium CG_4_9_14_3_um_filter_49_7]